MSLGARMMHLRMKAKESLQQVADAVDVSKAHIWELEKEKTNNPSIGLVARLSDHFKVSIAYLAGEDIDAPDADKDLQRMFRQAKDLDDHERKIIDQMMQNLIENRPTV